MKRKTLNNISENEEEKALNRTIQKVRANLFIQYEQKILNRCNEIFDNEFHASIHDEKEKLDMEKIKEGNYGFQSQDTN